LHVAKIFGLAHAQAETSKAASSAFIKTRVCPTDPNVFGDVDFLEFETTEKPIISSSSQLGTSFSDHPIAEPYLPTNIHFY